MPSVGTLKMTVEGLPELFKQLEGLKKGTRRAVVRKAFRKLGAPMRKHMRSLLVPGHGYEFGVLKKSIAIKIGAVKFQPDNQYLIVGPKTKAGRKIGTHTRGKRAGKDKMRVPTKIAHLVEFGHGGPHAATPKPFIRPTMDAYRAKALALIQEGMREAIKIAAAKAAAKGKSIRK